MASISASLFASLLSPAPALAQGGRDDGVLLVEQDFDVPAQPLPKALLDYSRISGVQVLFDSKRAASMRSTGLKGRMSSGQALRLLLRGTGFTIRYASSRSVTLIRADRRDEEARLELNPLIVKAAPLRVGGRRVFADYADTVLGNLRRALQASELGQGVRFEISVSVWLDPAGRVARSAVHRSSGNPAIDEKVIERLADVGTAPPPAGMPQPLRFQLWAGSHHPRVK